MAGKSSHSLKFMCGIAGYVQRDRDHRTLGKMLEKLVHRGPDGSGQWFGDTHDWKISFGHRRLAIIDLKGGRQPLLNEGENLVLTANGEIYNFQEIRSDLEKKGYHFKTRSDSESIVHLFEESGTESFQKLNGMFAFAIWDHQNSECYLVRDRIGVKPLYYSTLPDGGLVFASELSSILCHAGVRRSLSAEGVGSYFYSDYSHAPHSLVQGVKKLRPGHFIRWKNGVLGQEQPYWDLNFERERLDLSYSEYRSELFRLLQQSVSRQMIADVPVGVFLSGGIDSSTIAALAQGVSNKKLKTFSIGFRDDRFDESPYARKIAQHIGSEHYEEFLDFEKAIETIDSIINRLDEPLGDASILPTFLVSKLASQHVKVVLGGDGGDELWGGYPTYQGHQYAKTYSLLPSWFRSLFEPAVGFLRHGDGYQPLAAKVQRFTHGWDSDPMRRHLRWMSGIDQDKFFQAFPRSKDLPSHFGDLNEWRNSSDQLNQILALDLRTYLPGSVLTKVDRASMANSLEVRPPLLDNDLVEWAFSVPSKFKLRRRKTKYLLKKTVESVLPKEVVYRKKQGFAVPVPSWLRGPLRGELDRVLKNSPLWETNFLDKKEFSRWVSLHEKRRRDFSRPLWSLLVLDRWLKRENVEFR